MSPKNLNVPSKTHKFLLDKLKDKRTLQIYKKFEDNLNINKTVISKTYLNVLEKFQETLEEYFKTEKSPAFYANKLNITTKHLNRISKVTLNKTCSTVIKERILLEAKRLLVHTNNPLASIALQLGFEEYSYFSKTFKTNNSCTPFEFRKRY